MIAYIKPCINSVLIAINIPRWVNEPISEDAPKITDEIYGYYAVEVPEEVFNAPIKKRPVIMDFELDEYGKYVFNNEIYLQRIRKLENENI